MYDLIELKRIIEEYGGDVSQVEKMIDDYIDGLYQEYYENC